MIETLSLRNFKVLRNVDLKLQPFSLLVGPNASGKSSILEALSYLAQFISLQSDCSSIFTGNSSWQALHSRCALGPLALKCRARYADDMLDLSIEGVNPVPATKWKGLRINGPFTPNPFRMKPSSVLSLDAARLASPSIPRVVSMVMPADGDGLASILANLYLQHPSRYKELIEQLKMIIPRVVDVRIRRIKLKNEVAEELLFDMQGADAVPAFAISGGTLITLGLLTVIAAPEPPQLVLIDELERGLHPKALGDLVSQLRRLQEQNPELQIVATSHSPYLLDHFKAEEILLTSLDEEGYAAVKPLTDHPEYEPWKDLMAPGEFWSTVGEKWVTEGDPKKASAAGR